MTQQPVFDKTTQPKTKKRKTPDKIEQKIEHEKNSAQRDGKSILWPHPPERRRSKNMHPKCATNPILNFCLEWLQTETKNKRLCENS